MKKYIYILLAVSVLSLVACSESGDNGGNGENETPSEEVKTDAASLKVNTYAIDGEVYSFGSVAVMMIGENISILATPEANVGSAEAILECDEYIYGAVSPTLVGKEFDVVEESSLYTFMSTLVGAELETVAPVMTEEIEAGKALFTYQNDVLNVKVDLTLTGGAIFSFHAEAKYAVIINENTISSIYGEKPLRAAFYKDYEDTTALFFTPAGISYSEELSIATWYLFVVVEKGLINGGSVDITTISSEDFFSFGMVDNVEDNSFEIVNGNLGGATGEFNIRRNGKGNYTALIDITYQGDEYTVAFTGECVSYDERMPQEHNYMVYKGEKVSLVEASLTKAESVWSVELKVEDGSTVVATAPATFFDGNARGFSQSADLTVSYKGVTYSKANGYSGTFTAKYDEAKSALTIDFTNYDNLKFNYSGSVAIK